MFRKLLAMGLVALTLAQGLAARQSPTTNREVTNIKKRVEGLFNEGARAIIEMRDGRRLQGSISEITDSEFVLVGGAYKATVAYVEVKKVKRQGHSVNARRIVAIAVAGGLLGLAIFAAHQDR